MRLTPLVLLSLVACSSSSSRGSGFDDGSSSGGSSSSSSSGGVLGGGDSGAIASPNQDGCSDAAKLVYVVSEENDLYSFVPNKGTFTKIGTLSCSSSATPNSMAVDRSGTAWVNYSDGSLFEVSTTDASCTKTSFAPGQNGFIRFGMAFATDSAGSTNETLYVAGIDDLTGGKGLAKIDLTTMKLKYIGDYSGSLGGTGAELTGTGDGRLFGFFTTTPYATLAKIDEGSAATTSNQNLKGVSTGVAWAFSFWGGDFWFYTSDGSPSKVTQMKASSDNSISTAKGDVGGFRIVGAGVSTCAPITPPPVN